MDRIYPYVSPEEYAEVRAAGARWDESSKSWYVGEDVALPGFARWLGEEENQGAFSIHLDAAFVASARCASVKCGEPTEVICIYCDSGVDRELGQQLERLTVSNIGAMDDYHRRAVGGDLKHAPRATPIPDCGHR